MNKLYLHITSEFDCGLSIDGRYIGECFAQKQSEMDIIVEGHENSFCAFVCPIISELKVQKIMAYGVVFSTALGSLSVNSDYVEIVRFPKNHYKIKFKCYTANILESRVLLVKNFNISGVKYSAKIINSGIFEVTKGDTHVYGHINFELNDYEVEKLGNSIYLHGFSNNKEVLSIYNGENITTIYADKIEIIGNAIKFVSSFGDIEKRGKVDVYTVNGNVFEKTDSYLVFLNQNPQKLNSAELIPLAFLEGIMAKDFQSAKMHLTESLKEKLSDDHLEDFFGDFSMPHIVTYYDKSCYATIVETKRGKFAKLYEFELDSNNKVNNINEL